MHLLWAYGSQSKEHFYPAWLAEFIDSGKVHNVAMLVTRLGARPKEVTERYRRQGHLITKTLRVVCRTCNNGWMSQMESAVKPLLVSSVMGQERTLELPDVTFLAQWVCLKAMLAEHADPELASTPAIDRRAFYE